MTAPAPLTRDGTPWVPVYLEGVDEETCIGCGRCFKVCGQGVLAMGWMTEDGDPCEADSDDAERMIATIANGGACVGCGACYRVCGTKSLKQSSGS
jgi:Nif-specific ferredoxin III